MIEQLPDGRVAIRFTKTDGIYTLSDAIVGDKADIAALSEADIANIQQNRWEKWYAVVTSPPEDVVDG